MFMLNGIFLEKCITLCIYSLRLPVSRASAPCLHGVNASVAQALQCSALVSEAFALLL